MMMQVGKVIFLLIILVTSCIADENNIEISRNDVKELKGNNFMIDLVKSSHLVMFYDPR